MCDVLIICALKDEYDQLRMVTNGIASPRWKERKGSDGWIVADATMVSKGSQIISVTATWATQMGREQAQAVASKLIATEPASCIAMCGICAGRRGKVALGDVIFAERLWSYDSGKLVVEEGKSLFQGDMLQYRPSTVWVQRMQNVTVPTTSEWLSVRPELPLESQEDWVLLRLLAGENPHQHPEFAAKCPDWAAVLQRLWTRGWVTDRSSELSTKGREQAQHLALLYPNGLPNPSGFQVHVAPMATGAAVVEDKGIFPRLASSMRKVLGIDMESSALAALGEAHGVPVIVAKGVSDFGDPFKDDRYRSFAARASAECLIKLLRESSDLIGVPQSSTATVAGPTFSNLDIPQDLIRELAEAFPDVRDARALWERAGGRGSEVENLPRPLDLWQRLWRKSCQGASVTPRALLNAVLSEYPENAVLVKHMERVTQGLPLA